MSVERPQHLESVREIKNCFKIPMLLPFYSNLPRLADLTVACQEKEIFFVFLQLSGFHVLVEDDLHRNTLYF